MSSQLSDYKSEMICNICKMFLHDPIFLPCHHLVCEEHVSGNDNTIKCLTCNEAFPKSKRFKSNETAQKIIKDNLHLNEKQKQAKNSFDNMILEFDTLLEDFQSNKSNFELEVHEHFFAMRNKIDYHREKIKNEIDDIAIKMAELTFKKEKSLIQKFKQDYSKIVENEIENEKRFLLDEFRNPNMIIENIKMSLREHEAEIKKLKQYMANFTHQTNQIKKFYFQPNESIDEKTFGILNLSYLTQKMISCSSDDTIKVWDLETFECAKTIDGHSDQVWSLEKVGNNQFLSCSDDQSIKLWDIQTGSCVKTFNDESEVYCIKIISQNTFASGSNADMVKVWNIDNGICTKKLIGHKHSVWDLLVLPNGSLVSCSGDTKIKVWNIDQGVCTKTLSIHTSIVYCLLLLNNGCLVSGSADKTIQISDLESGTCIFTLNGHTGRIFGLQLRQNGDLISASGDKTIKIWDLEMGSCIKTLTGHRGEILTIKSFQDDKLLSGSDDKTIKVWDLENGELIRTLNDHTYQINSFVLI